MAVAGGSIGQKERPGLGAESVSLADLVGQIDLLWKSLADLVGQ